MDFLFFKKISLLSLILSFIIGASYIQVGDSDLSFDYQDGDLIPIFYYLNIKNVGPQPARFDVSSTVPWIFVYREGLPGYTSLTLSESDVLNFVLEIHPEKAEEGSNLGQIIINAVNLSDYSIMETKKVNVVLNKNIQITTSSPAPTAPEEELTKTASPSLPESPKPKPFVELPMPEDIISPSPLPITQTPVISPAVVHSPETVSEKKPVYSPSPQYKEKQELPELEKKEIEEKRPKNRAVEFIKIIFSFIKNLFF